MIRRNMSPFQGSYTTGTGTAVMHGIPQGMTYEAILLELTGTAFVISDITEIRVDLGGKQIWRIPGADLQLINSYYGITADAARLPIWFADPNAKTLPEYLASALDTSFGYSDFSIEVDVAGATAPVLNAYSLTSAPIPRLDATGKPVPYVGTFRTLNKQLITPTSTGVLQNQLLSVGSPRGALIKAMHFVDGGNISQVDVTKDGFYLQQDGYRATMQSEQAERGRVIQVGLYSFDPLAGKHYLAESVATLKPATAPQTGLVMSDFQWDVEVTAAGTISAYADLVRTFGAL